MVRLWHSLTLGLQSNGSSAGPHIQPYGSKNENLMKIAHLFLNFAWARCHLLLFKYLPIHLAKGIVILAN